MKPSTAPKKPELPEAPEKTVLGRITFFADGLVLSESKRGGAMRKKTITLQDFYSSMSQEVSQAGPLMPPCCRQMTQRGDVTTLVLEVPETKRMLNYARSGGVQIRGLAVFPLTIMILSFTKTKDNRFKMTGSSIYSRPAPLQSLNDPLFSMPYHNVHSNNQICWGNVFSTESDTINSLQEAYRFVDLFFGSSFNGDLQPRHREEIRDQKTGKTIRFRDFGGSEYGAHEGFLKYTTTVDAFPNSVLVEASITLNRALGI